MDKYAACRNLLDCPELQFLNSIATRSSFRKLSFICMWQDYDSSSPALIVSCSEVPVRTEFRANVNLWSILVLV